MVNWKQQTSDFFQAALDFAFPPVCVECQKPGKLICDSCYADIFWLSEQVCPGCLEPTLDGDCCEHLLSVVQTAVSYIGPIPSAIHQLKYEGQFALAKPLADLMHAAWQPNWHIPDIVLPIPLNETREKKRTYNQSALIAKHFCQKQRFLLSEHLLLRVKRTPPQVGLSARERRENVMDAFRANEAVHGKTILLIDDVYTTGATATAAAAALQKAGAASVSVLTLAKASVSDY